MTRRGQNPYATNSSSGFQSNSSYSPSTPAYDAPRGASFSQAEADRQVPSAKPFKTKGMQLGAKGRKNEPGLAEALGGLSVEEPLLREEERGEEPVYEQQQPQAVVQSKDSNPFGDVEEAE